ncbi:MAG: hypothetical protein ACM33T_06055 [Solirubrobacterales bacterium]
MARQSPSARILPIVETFVDHIEGKRRERLRFLFPAQSAYENALERTDNWENDERLPATNDGKVNVQALVERMGLKETDRQWMYKLEDLAGPINALALAQGLKPIKSRVQQQVDDEVAVAAITRAQTDSKRLAEALVEVTRERDQLRAQLQMVREGGWVIRTGKVMDDRR